jgi:hypothetical protein
VALIRRETADLVPQVSDSRGTGPLGKERGVVFVILFSIITLGIYYLVWVYKSHEEIKEHSGQGVGGVLGLVIALVVGFVTPFVLPSEIRKMYERSGRESRVSGWTGLWATLGILILIGPIIWFVKVQGALNRYWRIATTEPPAETPVAAG